MRDLIRSGVNADCMLAPDAVHEYAVHGAAPAVVVAPRSAAEAAAVLKLASSEGFAVECAGAGTRLREGNKARKLDVVMSSTRLRGITEYEPADLVIGVQTGTTLEAIGNTVAPYNQFLALDPPAARNATIGGTIATGAYGPLRFAHGTPRDQVLGLEVVTGDGQVMHYGGRVVKNVAGYDFVRLLVGSRGTLGFVTAVHLRLKPQPDVDHTLAIAAESFSQVADLAEAVLASGLEPVALEIYSASATRPALNARWLLHIRLQGNESAVMDAETRMHVLAGSAPVRLVSNGEWRAVAEQEAAAPVKLRIAHLPSAVRETVAVADRIAERAELVNPQLAVHAGDGIVRLLADGAGAEFARTIEAERAAFETHGGSVIVDKMPHGSEVEAFGHAEALQIMAQIKQVFDPAGILAPGRFVV